MSKLFAFVLIALAAATPVAQARVHSIPVFQTLEWPIVGENIDFSAGGVAIDGDSIIVLADTSDQDPTTRMALLYRRGADQRWAFSRILAQATAPRAELRSELAMKNYLAAFKIHRDTAATFLEKTGNNWVQAQVTNGVRGPGGFAISGRRILVGQTGCDTDGLIYEKSGSGAWVITGQIARDAGVCADQPRAVELNYDYAFIRHSPSLVQSYRKNGSALAWPANRAINIPTQAFAFTGPIAVQLGTAVVPGSAYFTRGTNWTYAGQLKAVDYAMGTGDSSQVVYRDGVVLTDERWDVEDYGAAAYLYVPNASGGFDHVGALPGAGAYIADFDISGRTVVSAGGLDFGPSQAKVFVLPQVLAAPPAIANNFDARDISGLTVTPGTFVLAGNSSNYLLRRPAGSSVDAAAVFNGTDWRDFQFVEADVSRAVFSSSDGWFGVAVRYVDADNYYFAGVSGIGTFQIGRKVNGVFTILAEQDIDVPPNPAYRIGLSINGTQLIAGLTGAADAYLQAEDTSFTHGSAALVTHNASGDVDNTYVAPTAAKGLFYREWPLFDFGRPFTYGGGNWHEVATGLQQSDTSGNAFAIVPGPAIDNQTVTVDAILDSFGSTSPVSWFGVVARYVDQRNYYYLSVRSSGQLQIRKVVNGAVTPLKGVALNITPGSTHQYTFDVRGNELTASVDGVVRLRVIDNSLARGQYGLATYRASATYSVVSATQP
jgi:hypothetical protein